MQSAFAVTKPYLASIGNHTFICVARRAQSISGETLRLREYMAAEARATVRESFLRSKHAKRYSSLNQD